MNIWLLRPGVGGFSIPPTLLDDNDTHPGIEQLGDLWVPVAETWRLEGSALHSDGCAFILLGAIRLVAANELVLIFEGGHVAIMPGGSREFATAKLELAVTWLPSTETPPGDGYKIAAQTSSKQNHSYRPEVYFNHGWHDSGNRFATEAEAEVFVANLRTKWITQGFIKSDRVAIVWEAPNAFLIWKTKQAERLPEAESNTANEGRAG